MYAINPQAIICQFFFFFNDTATTEIYTLSLHDALPISIQSVSTSAARSSRTKASTDPRRSRERARSEEHTSELQSHSDLVCRLLLEKKKNEHVAGAYISKQPCHMLVHCSTQRLVVRSEQ